ncbi:MAG: hypothetical protein FJX56_00995, partial [Alphaproteobacteria bacterium]|nr:hypothetical protein [Alphaproteobacteria bacterium]
RIARAAGADPGQVVARILGAESPFGFDARTGRFGDLLAAGVLDAAKVVRTALANAVSAAGLALTTEATVACFPKPNVFVSAFPDKYK